MHPVSHNPQKKSNTLKYAVVIAAVTLAGTLAISYFFEGKKPQNTFHSKKPLASDSIISKKPKERKDDGPDVHIVIPAELKLPELVIVTPLRHAEKKADVPKPKPLSRKEVMLELLKSKFSLESVNCEIIGKDSTEKPKTNTSLSDSMEIEKESLKLMSDANGLLTRENFEKLVDDAVTENDLESLVKSMSYLLSLNIMFEGESGLFEFLYSHYLSIAAKKNAGLSEVDVDRECLTGNFDAMKHLESLVFGLGDIFNETGDSEQILSQFPKDQHTSVVLFLFSSVHQQLNTNPEGFQKLFLSLSDEHKKMLLQQLPLIDERQSGSRGRGSLITNLVNVTNDQELKNRLMEIMMNSSSN